jgi:16S rRNA G1207 methylase RsmC
MIDIIMEEFKKLKRYPHLPNSDLQAWDAADELILNSEIDFKNKNILIINDSFGALSLALNEYSPTSYTDSYVATKAISINVNSPKLVNDLTKLGEVYDLVLIKLPKNLSFFEDILIEVSKRINDQSKVICASMIKHMAKGHFDLVNKYIGETTTSLAKKKARLIFSKQERELIENMYPKVIDLPVWPNKIENGSNLFSREKLDIGTRFFLENIPTGNFDKILDLGCANGIIGLTAKKKNLNSSIVFSDESYLSIQCAKNNYAQNFEDQAQFFFTNCLEDYQEQDIDLVLCNPPFHQGTTIGDFIAWQMFKDAHRSLKQGGKLRVIGNSHLGYQTKLKKIFKNSEIINKNKKFVVIDAYKK